MRVKVRGITYKNVAECALKLNVTKSTVYTALSQGDPETIGLGRKGFQGEKIIVYGTEFKNKETLSLLLGMNKGYVAQVYREGSMYQHQKLKERVMRYKQSIVRKSRCKQTKITDHLRNKVSVHSNT